ncbi:MAG: alkaline phosphatase [Hyphomonas sp.]|uniref:alkaline phosphatase n=1 Tax=Hyphomonas sp. TaxID=87 RepID=UPI003527029A
MRKFLAATLPALALLAACSPQTESGAEPKPLRTGQVPQQSTDAYYVRAAEAVDTRIAQRGVKPARNVIIFIGDGMGISTVTAARIYAGQKRGLDGESYRLTMETLPYTALSKTYSNDFQVADSASTATAMVTGVKTNSRTLGITSDARYDNCASIEGHRTDSLFDLAERAGLATGVVTTARLTHATPGATYSEVPNRDWEAYVGADDNGADGCEDIAAQFIDWPEGDGFEIAFGGGRSAFLKQGATDPEDERRESFRRDDRDLVAEWQAKSAGHKYIYDAAGFAAEDFTGSDKVLGLFEHSHLQYELDRADDVAGEPSLVELTRAAITRLSQDPDGFVLMVEGGRIDHAHHAGNAARALDETDMFDQAIAAALDMTNSEDTLIIVTADHSHTMTISGYPKRGNPILGLASSALDGTPDKALDGKPYTTLGYMNGPGACRSVDGKLDCTRLDLTDVDTTDKEFLQQSLYPMWSEAHGGEDVAIFASGPGAELVSGVMEQNEIFQVMGRASGLVAAPAPAPAPEPAE